MDFDTKVAVVLRDDVKAVTAQELDLVGLALRADRKAVDRILDKVRRHP